MLNVKIMGDDEAKKKNVDTKDKVSYGFVHAYIYILLHVTAVKYCFCVYSRYHLCSLVSRALLIMPS